MIRAYLKKWSAGLMVSTYALLAVGLVTYDVLRGVEWYWPSFVAGDDNLGQVSAQQDEIQKYVLFTQVQYGSKTVHTGVERASDRDRKISKQWCYIYGTLNGGRVVQLTLATKEATDSLSIPNFTQTALADFDLTRAQARALVTSHCRFQ